MVAKLAHSVASYYASIAAAAAAAPNQGAHLRANVA